jgi:hypothetical protein
MRSGVHERTGRGEQLARLEPGLQAPEDQRPAAIELGVRALAQLVVGHAQVVAVTDGLVFQVILEVPSLFTSSPQSVTMLWTSFLGGSTSRFSPSPRGPGAPSCVISKREPGVKSELIRLPNWYLLLMSGSVIASQEALRGGADVDLMYLLYGALRSVLEATELGRPGLWARSLRLEDR